MLFAFALENDVLAVGRKVAFATAAAIEGELPHAGEELVFAFGFVCGGEVAAQESQNQDCFFHYFNTDKYDGQDG